LIQQAEALSILAHALQHRCDWRDRDAIFAAVSQAARAQIQAGVIPSCQPFHALVYPLPARVILEISKSYARKSAANLVCTLPRQQNYPRHRGRLTIGYVMNPFDNHLGDNTVGNPGKLQTVMNPTDNHLGDNTVGNPGKLQTVMNPTDNHLGDKTVGNPGKLQTVGGTLR